MMTKTFHSNQSWRVALATVALLLAAMACTKDSVDDQDLAELESAQSEGLSADDALAGYFQGAEKGEYVLSVDTLEIFDPETFESRFELVYNFSSANGTNHRSFTRSMSTAPGMTAGTSELVRNQEVFKIAEVMPHFPDPNCTSDDRACYEKALLENLYGNIRYPQADKDAGVEGKVLVQFVVGTDGELLEPRIIRSPSEAMSAEVLRVLGEMPAWVPGRQRGQDVQVSFVLPVQFKLE